MGKKVALSIFLLFFSVLSVFTQSSYERGERLYMEGNYPLALDAFDAFLRSSPDSPFVADAQFRRAQILFHLKRYKEADELFQRIEVRYSSTQYYAHLPFWSGMAAYGLKDYGRAEQLLSKYLRGNPSSEARKRALLYRSLAQKELGRLSEAKEGLQQLFTPEYLQTPDPEALVLYGAIALSLGDLEGLVSFYRQVSIEKLPEPARSRFLLFVGEACYQRSLYREAVEVFASVSPTLEKEKVYALKRAIQCFASLREPQYILTVLEEGRRSLKNSPASLAEVWEFGGRHLFRAREYENTIRYLEILKESGIGLSSYGLGILADSYRRTGNLSKAYSVLLGVPSAEDLLLLQGQIEAQMGNWAEAEKTLRSWFLSYPNSSLQFPALFLLVWVVEKQGRIEDALNITYNFSQTSILPEEALVLLRYRAVLLGKLGRDAEALSVWETYLKHREEDVEGRIERLRLLLSASRKASVILKEVETLIQKGLPPHLLEAVRLLKGVALLEERSFTEAKLILEQVAFSKGQSSSRNDLRLYATFYLGWAYYQLGNYTASLDVYRSLLKELDLNSELRERSVYYGAWSAYTLKQFDLAYSLLNSFLIRKESPLWARAWFLRAKTLYMLGKKRDAQEAFQTVFTEKPVDPLADDALYEYAKIFEEFDQPDQASEAYLTLFQRYPSSPFKDQSLYRRGETFYASKRYREAKVAFSQYRSMLPRGVSMDRTLYWEGMASYRVGEPYAAVLLWERLIWEYPRSTLRSEALIQVSTVLSELGEYSGSLRYLKQLAQEYPEEGRSDTIQRRIRELELLQTGATDREASLKVQLEESNGVTTERGRRIAIELVKLYLYEMGGKRAEEEAERWLKEILAQGEQKELSEVKFLMGDLSRLRGNLLEAATYYGEAASSPTADTDLVTRALYQAVKVLALAGRQEEARKYFEVLQKRFPESPWTLEGGKVLGLP
ncbi:MAG: tetratricopeptide repeat protein [Spirochaetes bacterium]|nr:tetratricopeptide repeat protein [Spirochaetota bacterium]